MQTCLLTRSPATAPDTRTNPRRAPGALALRAPLPLWDQLRTTYLATRPARHIADGDTCPDTQVGEVRRVLARMAWALSHPRFDHCLLGDVRRAWKDAVHRVHRHASGLGWHHTYPDNPRFWQDARDLAVALHAVDTRRRALVATPADLPVPVHRYADLRLLWGDLRYWWSLRRPVARDRASLLTYPATTVAEVKHAAQLIAAHAVDADVRAGLGAYVERVAGDLAPTDPFPDNAGFWCRDARSAVGMLGREVASWRC